MISKFTISTVLIIFAAGCSSAPDRSQVSSQDTGRATALSGGTKYAVIEFKPKSSELTEGSRIQLRSFAFASTAEGRKIDEIKVLSWADREYPAQGTKASKSEIKLAKQRNDQIKDFLEADLGRKIDIDEHNMAARPSAFSEVINTEDYKIKRNFEGTGAAPISASLNETQLVGSKVSKAVVFVKYQ